MKNKWVITATSLMLSVTLGIGASVITKVDAKDHSNHPEGFKVQNENLQQELYQVDLIVRGVVEEQQPTYKQDAGLKGKMNFSFEVTPAKIRVDEVLYGQTPAGETINLLQHGNASDVVVQEGEEVILLLSKTSWGDYWSYDYSNGIWKVEDGKVASEAYSPILEPLNHLDAETFEKSVSRAALQKQLNPALIAK
ncbi:hypothetical protein ACX12E_18685 [Paenibacillus vandeheii]